MISQVPLPEIRPFSAGVTAILNAGSGDQRQHEFAEMLPAIFREHNVELEIRMASGPEELFRLARAAVRGRKSIVLAGGGDGTVSAIASVVAGSDTALGVLPCGTFNYFARQLGIPLEPEAAARVCLQGEVKTVSLGEVNGRVFINNASIGLYPSLLREREEVYSRWGRSRLAAYVSAVWGLARPRPYLDLDMRIEGKQKRFRTPMIFAAHNPYQIEDFGMAGSACIERGKLAFYVLPPTGRLGLLRLGWRMMRKKLEPATDFHLLCSDEAHVHVKRHWLSVAYDGELVRMQTPLVFRMRQQAVRVMVPRASGPEVDAA